MSWTEIDSAVTSPAETGIAFSAMQASVILNCDNLPTQDPHYAKVGSYINEAVDEFMTLTNTERGKKLLDLMPRLRNWRWYDVTIDGQNYLALPDTMLDLESVTCTRLTTAYAPSSVREYPMYEEPDPVMFGLYDKTQTGFPVKWRRAGSRLEMWPTPHSSPTNYLTMVVLRGTRRESALSGGTDTLKMDLKLQNFVIELATAITMEKMGWEEAAQRRVSVETRLNKYLDLASVERTRTKIRTFVAGTPR